MTKSFIAVSSVYAGKMQIPNTYNDTGTKGNSSDPAISIAVPGNKSTVTGYSQLLNKAEPTTDAAHCCATTMPNTFPSAVHKHYD
jgi:hypothetical protein